MREAGTSTAARGSGGAEADGRRQGGEGEVGEAVRCRTRPGPPRGVGRRAAGRRRAAPLTVEDREVEVLRYLMLFFL